MACKTSILVALIITLTIGIGSCISGSTNTPAFFIFGDSTVDPGNNNYIQTIFGNQAHRRPYGLNGFFDKPTGRFSDGRVIVDFIAQYAKLPIIPPFLQPSIRVVNGVNFASGGAGVLTETNHGLVIPLQKQLTYFEEVELLLEEELGEEQSKKIISEAVYFFSIGSNDYMGGYMLNPQLRESFSPQEYVGMVIGNLTQTIQTLYAKGGRKFGFLSLCSLGCLPALRSMNPKANGDCIEEVSLLASAHNHALSLVLTKLERELQGFKYCNSNFYDWLSDRIHHPTKYGFKDGVNACCGSGPYNGAPTCGVTNIEDGKEEYSLCKEPKEHIWWDAFHPSEALHEQFAQTLWSGSSFPVGPYNLESLFLGSEEFTIADMVDNQDMPLPSMASMLA